MRGGVVFCAALVVLYNLVCSAALLLSPDAILARFQPRHSVPLAGPSAHFFLHSIASFHLHLALLTVLSFGWLGQSTRRVVAFLNALINAYDAISQYLYWGPRVWSSPSDQALVDVGIATFVALIAFLGWYLDQPVAASKRS